jgi:hypothetical protein
MAPSVPLLISRDESDKSLSAPFGSTRVTLRSRISHFEPAPGEGPEEAAMLSKSARDFILHITNYFHGHWEDPEWGKRPENQLLIALAIRTLSGGIQETMVREEIQAVMTEVIAKNGQAVAKS